MMKFLKKFDVHAKAMDGVNQQTYIGAVASVVAIITVILLITAETSFYLKRDTVSRMQPDSVIGPELVNFELALDFATFPCDKLEFSQEVTRGAVHQHLPPVISKKPAMDDRGCSFSTVIETDKMAGSVRVGYSGPIAPQTDTVLFLGGQKEEPPPADPQNELHIGHAVNTIMFHAPKGKSAADKFPDIKHPLIRQVAMGISPASAVHHYSIQIVPTYYKDISGKMTHINQYSVSQKTLDKPLVAQGVMLGGGVVKDFQGVIINYDFSPVVLIHEERQESIFEFLAGLCGIVGGLITVIGLFERCVSTSAKAIIGKKD